VTGIDPHDEMRRAVLGALSRVLADLPALLAVLAEADDENDAVRRLEEAYDFTPVQAQAVLDVQFRLVTRARRAAVDAELRDVTVALAAPWDPPLDLQATVRSPQLVELVIAGVDTASRARTWTIASATSCPWFGRAWPGLNAAGSR